MRSTFLYGSLPILLFCQAFFSGCYPTSVVISQKPDTVFSRVMVIFEDEGCDLMRFDSLSYQICLQSCFRSKKKFALRKKVENMFVKKFQGMETGLVLSSDLFNPGINSYADFMKAIDSLHIDALLILDLMSNAHDENEDNKPGGNHYVPGQIVNGSFELGHYEKNVPTLNKIRSVDNEFECSLRETDPDRIGFAVWIATIDDDRMSRNDKIMGPKQSMIDKILRKLKRGGYIAPERNSVREVP
jgi:hypothetical protein